MYNCQSLQLLVSLRYTMSSTVGVESYDAGHILSRTLVACVAGV
jgi:hypothetical protein